MTLSLKIAIADDEPEILADLEETLVELGHTVAVRARNGVELVDQCHNNPPDLVITDIKMPVKDGLQAISEIRQHHPVPIVILSAYHDSDLIKRALDEHVLAYLVKPVNDESLQTSIELAVRRFKEFQALQSQTADLQQALEDRKVIERAKGVLMKRAELSEADAFRRLQLLSSQKNKKMIEIARAIIEAEEAFES